MKQIHTSAYGRGLEELRNLKLKNNEDCLTKRGPGTSPREIGTDQQRVRLKARVRDGAIRKLPACTHLARIVIGGPVGCRRDDRAPSD